MISSYKYPELEKISLSNFKPFLEKVEIEIKPITVLIGPNSSGKSSIIQFLLFLKQSCLNRMYKNPFTLNGEYIDLDSYRNIIYGHNIRRNMKFGITVKLGSNIRYAYQYILARNREGEIYIKELKIRNKTNNKLVLTVKSNSENKITSLSSGIRSINKFLDILQNSNLSERENQLQDYLGVRRIYIPRKIIETSSDKTLSEIIENFIKKKDSIGFKNGYETVIIGPSKAEPFRPKIIKLENIVKWTNFQLETYFDEFSLRRYSPTLADFFSLSKRRKNKKLLLSDFFTEARQINRIRFHILFSNIYYLGPIREYPKRYYITTEKIPEHVGSTGEKVISAISPQIIPSITKWLKRFELGSKLEIETVKGKIKEIIITDKLSKIKSNITDVGFGLSQILPLIVESAIIPKRSIFLVEQPEIHLHPKIQAEIGDLLIDIAHNRKKVIVETHSEHLLLRLRRRIVEGELDVNDIRLYYFLPTDKGTVVKNLKISENGYIQDWPNGFFDNDFDEFLMIQKALAKKKGGDAQ